MYNRYGEELVETCRIYKGADAKVARRALRVETCWYRTRVQLNVIRQIHGDLDEQLITLQMSIYEILLAKLQTAKRKLDGLHR